ncbi:hypothetical protein Y032_0608g604 [Ancylostoma ceylanicum]|uniref:Uncharacterized protein n=1 Tax=Ancylostoma ceylanicum TaxID=53326 RepID=A0A016WMT1_9BILA|nr:hypothetical protein Y032_0608g604 [Ancylostoma ceylanicum]
MRIENFSQDSSYNGAKLTRPEMTDLHLLRRSVSNNYDSREESLSQNSNFRTYRVYLMVALVISVLLLCTTIVLAVLLYQKIHRLDQVVSSYMNSDRNFLQTDDLSKFRRTNSISVEDNWAQPKLL